MSLPLALAVTLLLAQDPEPSPHRRLHENGQVAAEGAYLDGKLQGEWKTWYPDGKLRTVGEFHEGVRTGKWQLFHPNGQLAGEGRYRLGMRDRKWVYLDPEGVKIEGESGLYRTDSELYGNREKKHRVEVLGEERHGRWMSWWVNGAPQLEGTLRHGEREGRWVFRLPDGSVEAEFITGFYRGGMRVEAPGDGPPDPFEIPEEHSGAEAEGVGRREVPPLPRPPGVELHQRRKHKEWIALYLDDPDEVERAKAGQILIQYGRDAVPDVLNRFAQLLASDPPDLAAARRLHALLRSICRGRGFEWPDGADDPELARRTFLRWYAWWVLCELEDAWWARLAAGDAPAELLSPEIFDGLPPLVLAAREPEEAGGAFELDVVKSELFRDRARARPDRKVRSSIEAGLDWLALHQSPDGAWRCVEFQARCRAAGNLECEGTGIATNDVGVTALALLAFLADGNTTRSGDHSAVVEAATRWLIDQCDPDSGLFGEKLGHAFLYNHAIATTALAEVAHFTDSPFVREPLARAVQLILAARNPQMAWRYNLPPNGENDTSMTGWMVHALYTADAAGIEIDPDALEEAYAGALAWIDKATSKETGRIGYDSKGSKSARVPDVNDHFPPERGEAMTAVGLFTQILLGLSPSRVPILGQHVDLLLARPPVWAPEDFDCDMYYWYHGTNALAQVGGDAWDRWQASLRGAVIGSQIDSRGCSRGSWNPVGPWCYAGGRVYSTALLVLCLQGEFRYPRLGDR